MSASSDPSDPPSALPSTRTADIVGLTVADVMHPDTESLPATATIGELREWFAVSPSRRLAVIAGERYAGSIRPGDIPPDAPADRPALEIAVDGPTLSPETSAVIGRDLVIETEGRRVPVVDVDGRLHGVLAVTSDLRFFACRPAPTPT